MTDQIRTGQVIDALLALCRTVPGFVDPATCADDGGAAVRVWDGPEWQLVDAETPGGHLVIGWSGDRASPSPSADTDWVGGPIAGTARPRDETTRLVCLASARWAETPKAARDAALSTVSAVAAVCRADPSLGINTSGTVGGIRTLTFVTGGSLTQSAREDGYTASQMFTITYKTRV